MTSRSPPAMLFHRQPVSLRIDIPVDDFLPSHPTPDEVVSAKRASLSTPRTAKSPEELARAEKMSGLLHKAHIEAVQARAAREGERAREAKARRLRHEESERQRLQASSLERPPQLSTGTLALRLLPNDLALAPPPAGPPRPRRVP